MKITEQTLRELLLEPSTIAELIAKPSVIDKLYGGVKPYDSEPAEAFHVHVELCPACSNHIKAMCNDGRRLLNEWAISYKDSRVN